MGTGTVIFIIVIVVLVLIQQNHIREMNRENKLQERHDELLQQQRELAEEAQDRASQREWDRTHSMSFDEEFTLANYGDIGGYTDDAEYKSTPPVSQPNDRSSGAPMSSEVGRSMV